MERIGKVITLTALAYLLMACSEPDSYFSVKTSRSEQSLEEGFGVNLKQVKQVEAGFDSNGQPTVTIVIGSNRRSFFEVTLLRSNVKEGYTVHSRSLDHPDVMLSAVWNGDRYIQSSGHATSANLKIHSITPDKAVIYISGTLVNPTTHGFLILSPSMIRVQGEFLNQLLADQ